MTDLQKRKELEEKIKQCDLNSLAVSIDENKSDCKFWVVFFQRCYLLMQHRENYGEEAYQQLREQLEEAHKDYLNNARSWAKTK